MSEQRFFSTIKAVKNKLKPEDAELRESAMTNPYKDWMITWHNPPINSEGSGLEDLVNCKDVHYFVYQLERTKEGNLHWQIFIQLKTAVRGIKKKKAGASALEKLLKIPEGVNPHVERRWNTTEACIFYCSKEDSRVKGPWEWGTPQALHKDNEGRGDQGTRNDLTLLKDKIYSGASKKDIAEAFPSHVMKMPHHIMTNMRLAAELAPRRSLIHGIWYWGPSGAGKTRAAKELINNHYRKGPEDTHNYASDPDYTFVKRGDDKWWDGYLNQPVVLVDDFSSFCDIPFKILIHLLEPNDVQGSVEVKGGKVLVNAELVIFTALEHPKKFIPEKEDPIQLGRRLTKVIEIKKDSSRPVKLAEGW